MLSELSNKDYVAARVLMRQAIQAVADRGIEVEGSAFKALFKQQALKLYERILDDPETYKVSPKEKKEQINE